MADDETARELAARITKALEATATIAQSSHQMIEIIARTGGDVARLSSAYDTQRATLESLELLLYKSGETSLITTVSKLKAEVLALSEELKQAGASKSAMEQVRVTGQYSLKAVVLTGLFGLLCAIVGGLIQYVILRLTAGPPGH